MTPREEKVMLRDIHKIAQALESISQSIKQPIKTSIGVMDIIACNTEETDEETRE